MSRRRRAVAALLAVAVPLATGGCFTPGAIRYGFNDAAIDVGAAPTLAEVDGGKALVIPMAVTDAPFLLGGGSVGRRWIAVPVGEDGSPPQPLAAPDWTGFDRLALIAKLRGASPEELEPLVAAATAERDDLVAVRPAPDASGEAVELVYQYARLSDAVVLLAYAPAPEMAAATRSGQLVPVDGRGQPRIPYRHAIVLPYTVETTAGDKAARATVGVVTLPLGIVGDAALLTAGVAVAAVAGPAVGIGYLVKPLYR